MKMMKRINTTTSPPPLRKRIRPTACLVLALIVLMACGGGGSSGSFGDLVAGGGIGGTGITIGAISGFGSVIVNDVYYGTNETKVFLNGVLLEGQGDSVVLSNLAIGMVVRIESRYQPDGSAEAQRIYFTGSLNGPVQSITPIDSKVKILSILGQSVIVDDQTHFENTNFDEIAVGDVVEVSGWPNADGQLRATYAGKITDPPTSGSEVMIKGTVTESISDQRLFRINQLIVDMIELDDAVEVPDVGQLVMVYGDLDNNGILVAGKLEIENELGVEDSENVEIEGIVTQVPVLPAVDYDFILGSTKIKTDEATNFVGLTIDDIMPGARLLVEGTLSQGVLLADEVKAKDKVDIEGSVGGVAMDDMVKGEIALSGLIPLVVGINSATKIFGQATELSEIRLGQHVKILGYATGTEYVIASQVKVNKKQRSKVKLQGPIDYIEDPIISVFGIEIDVEEIEKDGSVIPSGFFDQAIEGDTVNVMGDLDGDSVNWKEIELLNFDN